MLYVYSQKKTRFFKLIPGVHDAQVGGESGVDQVLEVEPELARVELALVHNDLARKGADVEPPLRAVIRWFLKSHLKNFYFKTECGINHDVSFENYNR